MKSNVFRSVTSVIVISAAATAVACGPGGRGQSYPSSTDYPYSYYPRTTSAVPANSRFGSNAANSVAASTPQARLTVLPADDSSGVSTPSIAVPSASVHVVADEPKTVAKSDTVADDSDDIVLEVKEDATTKSKAVAKAEPVIEKKDNATLAEGLKGLVGTWRAVARQGDGGLSTIELQLDQSGWAKVTLPGPDGKPSTITRQVEFNNDEIKLKGEDADVALGKLVASNSRQFVLDQAGGQVTFVRP